MSEPLNTDTGVPRTEIERKYLTRSQIDLRVDRRTRHLRNNVEKLKDDVDEVKRRVIGIDGNGTGKTGTLQRLEKLVTDGFDKAEAKNAEQTARLVNLEERTATFMNKKTLSDYMLEGLTQSKAVKLLIALAGICTPITVVLGAWIAVWQYVNRHHPVNVPTKTTVIVPAPIKPEAVPVPTVPSRSSE